MLAFTQPLRPQLGTSSLTLSRQSDGTFARQRRQPLHRRDLAGGRHHPARPAVGRGAPAAGHRRPGAHGVGAALLRRPADALHHRPRQGSFSAGVHRPRQARRGHLPRHVLRLRRRVGAACPAGHHRHDAGRGTPTILVSRPFDPVGHYVADVTVPSGKTRYDLIATLADGEVLSTYVVIAPGSVRVQPRLRTQEGSHGWKDCDGRHGDGRARLVWVGCGSRCVAPTAPSPTPLTLSPTGPRRRPTSGSSRLRGARR